MKMLPNPVWGLHLELPAKVSAVNLEFTHGPLDYEDWRQTLFKIVQLGNWSNWALGACLVEGEARYGEAYAQAVSEAQISPDRAIACKYVYERIPELIRIKDLNWSVHREIAALPNEALRQEWLEECHKHGWTVSELKEKLKEAGLRQSRTPHNRPQNEQNEPGRGVNEQIDTNVTLCAYCHVNPAKYKLCKSCLVELGKV